MTDREELPPPIPTYEVCAHRLDLTELGADEPVALPAGWYPIDSLRQGEDLVLLLVREVKTA